MATYTGKLKEKTSSGFDILHPETEASVVTYTTPTTVDTIHSTGATTASGAIDALANRVPKATIGQGEVLVHSAESDTWSALAGDTSSNDDVLLTYSSNGSFGWTTVSGITSGVTGVKGNAESTYRSGNVNLTPSNLGAAPVSHASSATTYGVGTTSNYGHVKTQSGDMNGTSSTDGIAAGLGHTHSNYLGATATASEAKKVTNSFSFGAGDVVYSFDGSTAVSARFNTSYFDASLSDTTVTISVNSSGIPILSDGKIPTTYLPDVILGQMLYGGTVGANAVATLTTNAKTKLGTTSASITLTNDTTAITGYKANEGIYYIASAAVSFASLSLATGDWLISTGSAWKKIDNTDAVTGIKGNSESSYRTGNVNITAANVGAAPAAGSTSITTLGTVTTGTWQGTAIADSYIASAATWNGKQNKIAATGSATNPVYFSAAGTVASCSYELNKTVPSDAVFTDTTYSGSNSITIGTGNAISVKSQGVLAIDSNGLKVAFDSNTLKNNSGSLEVQLSTGLKSTTSGIAVDLGTASTQAAYGNHTHSGVYVPVSGSTVTASTYSAVTVNANGLVTAGYQSLAIVEASGSVPTTLVTGGWYFQKD